MTARVCRLPRTYRYRARRKPGSREALTVPCAEATRGEVTVSVQVHGKTGGHVAAEALDAASFDAGLPGEWAIGGRGPGRYALVPVRGGEG